MTEAQWLACDDPKPMLEFLHGKTSDRKMRLFICACCRLIWELIDDETCRRSVEVGERYADGRADEAERQAAFDDVDRVIDRVYEVEDSPRGYAAPSSTGYATSKGGHASALSWSAAQFVAAAADTHGMYDEAGPLAQVGCVQDIFGNPFRPATIDSSWLTSTVTALARQMYESRDFSAMPILADALQDAGCDNDAILDHCRGSGPHVRGCWVVDLVLGKE